MLSHTNQIAQQFAGATPCPSCPGPPAVGQLAWHLRFEFIRAFVRHSSLHQKKPTRCTRTRWAKDNAALQRCTTKNDELVSNPLGYTGPHYKRQIHQGVAHEKRPVRSFERHATGAQARADFDCGNRPNENRSACKRTVSRCNKRAYRATEPRDAAGPCRWDEHDFVGWSSTTVNSLLSLQRCKRWASVRRRHAISLRGFMSGPLSCYSFSSCLRLIGGRGGKFRHKKLRVHDLYMRRNTSCIPVADPLRPIPAKIEGLSQPHRSAILFYQCAVLI